jgi:alpha-beta hydrolase superfamily lysophospholipase
MSGLATPRPTYASEAGWLRIDALLPQAMRLDPASVPTEEWLAVGSFAVHLDCMRRPEALASLILVHGGGGNGRILAPYAAFAAAAGYETVAPDLPGYGLTQVPNKGTIRYQDWRDVLAAVIEAQARRGTAPIVVFGGSMGGMLAYDATARTRIPVGLVATCFLDPRDPAVRRCSSRWPKMVPVIEPLLMNVPEFLQGLPVPMRLVVNMGSISNEPELSEAISTDPRAGGNSMPAGFLRTFLASGPLVPPETFDVCPVLLTHPADDRWTDIALSRPFFDRLKVPKRLVMLDNAGHLPIEEPGVSQLRAALLDFIAERSRRDQGHDRNNQASR